MHGTSPANSSFTPLGSSKSSTSAASFRRHSTRKLRHSSDINNIIIEYESDSESEDLGLEEEAEVPPVARPGRSKTFRNKMKDLFRSKPKS